MIRTVKVGIRRQGFLDYLWLTDYEIIDPALSGRPDARACSTRGSGTRVARQVRARTRRRCSIVYWTDAAVAERPGAHERRSVRVRQPDFNGDTDTYYNSADEPERLRQHAVRRARTRCSTRSACTNAPVVPRERRSRERLEPAVPAREHGDPHAGRRRARRHRLSVHRADDDHAAQRRATPARWTSTSPQTKSTNPGCGPGTNLEPADQRRDLRADRADRRLATRTTRRARARRATATST